jgi:Holliday junction DNA helicase RuvB
MTDSRVVAPQEEPEDVQAAQTLRPQSLEECIGQDKVREHLRIAITAAKQRQEPLDHTLFHGPPGLGKTTFANVLATEMGVNIKITAGPAIERPGDLAAILSNIRSHDILFIDEVHRLNRTVEEILYPAMEDFALDIIMGKGMAARSIRLSLPQFSLIGATTRLALMSSPLRDRFGAHFHMEYYDLVAMRKIVERSAGILGVAIDTGGISEIAHRSRGTPRITNRLLRRIRDWAQVKGDGSITASIAGDCLESLEIDGLGLDGVDRTILLTIMEKFGGGPVGIDTLSAAIGDEAQTIEDVYEPYLMQLGFLAKTPRGRVVLSAAYKHLGVEIDEPADSGQPRLFD